MSGGGDTPGQTLIRVQTGDNAFIFGYTEGSKALFFARDVENPSTEVWVANNSGVVENIIDLTGISNQLIEFINSHSELELESIEGLASDYAVSSVVEQWERYELITR